MTRCAARRQGDETFCHVCNLRWDVNDPTPPLCRLGASPEAHVRAALSKLPDTPARIATLRRLLDEEYGAQRAEAHGRRV